MKDGAGTSAAHRLHFVNGKEQAGDFRINPENEDLLERAKIYAKEILAPRAEEIDQEGIFPRENFNDLAKEGFTSLTIPKDQGGRDLYEDTATYSMVLYELSKGCTNTAMLFHMHSSISHVITYLGTDEQKRRYSEFIRSGKSSRAMRARTPRAFTACCAWRRSDPGRRRLQDQRQEIFLLHGRRGGLLRAYGCSLKTRKTSRKPGVAHRAFGQPRFKIDQEWNSFAMRGTMSHSMIYDDVQIPVEDLVGRGGDPNAPTFCPSSASATPPSIWAAGGGASTGWSTTRNPESSCRQRAHRLISRHTAPDMGDENCARGRILMLLRAGWMIQRPRSRQSVCRHQRGEIRLRGSLSLHHGKALKVAGAGAVPA